MTERNLTINRDRLLTRLQALGRIGALEGGGVCRLALSDEDKLGRDLVIGWMRELGLSVTIDRIGNVVGIRPGREAGSPVMAGSHVDTVRTGGLYDGSLGVLAGLVGLAFVGLMVVGDAGNPAVFGPIGHGGAERMIVYPVMLWLLAFGGYLLAREPQS